jgi:hypothetical protein
MMRLGPRHIELWEFFLECDVFDFLGKDRGSGNLARVRWDIFVIGACD